jgi:hypothetical protein
VLRCRPFFLVLIAGLVWLVPASSWAAGPPPPATDDVERSPSSPPETIGPEGPPAPSDPAAASSDEARNTDDATIDDVDPQMPVGRTHPADALAMTLAAAAGSGGGLAAVAATAFVSTYIVTNVFRIGGFTFTQRYWRWGALGAIPVVASLAAIPIGAAFGIWWGAGLRGLPLPLVDALALMVVGLSLGTLSGALIAGPAGLMGGTFLGGWLLLSGNFDYIVWFQGYGAALALAMVGVPLLTAAAGALLGGVVGAAAGPVLTGAQWGLGAKASYFEE